MKAIFGHPTFYLAIPFYVAAISVLALFHVPNEFLPWLAVFPALASVAISLDLLLLPAMQAPNEVMGRALHQLRASHNHAWNQFALLVGMVVLSACFVDLYVNGLKIFDAAHYTDLSVAGSHIRHVSNMCWIFVPIAYFCSNFREVRRGFIIAAIVFPILFVDRNRLIQSVFCMVWLNLSMSGKTRVLSIKLIAVVFMLLLVFIIIGFTRSGVEAFVVPSSGYLLFENQYPLRSWFLDLPASMQQVLLYISAPIFNFATVGASGYKDSSLLLSQMFSFLGYATSDVAPPVLVPRYNVGTEFFPFLLYGGVFSSALAFLGMTAAVLTAHVMLLRRPNIFYLLIYLRLTYCCLMSGFAPQFYTWTNIDFLLMCLLLYQVCPLFMRRSGLGHRQMI